jgi:GNAT superfamily N-acetyltransferase
MKIIDLDESNRKLFAVCLEDWSEEAREAGNHRACWIDKKFGRGLRAKLAVDEYGTVGGMIQYLPIEESFVGGEGLYFIHCIWVHGHKKGRGNFQGKGMGKMLLDAAEEDVRALGAKGIAAWGVALPFWMKASWFKKHGLKKADRQGLAALMWKPFSEDAKPPFWFKDRKPIPELQKGKVTVTAFVNGWCMASNVTLERVRKATGELGDKIVFREIDTSDRKDVQYWGYSDSVFVDEKEITTGPPLKYEKIMKILQKKAAKL